MINHGHITWGDVPKNTIWGSFGPLGPSRGICRPNRAAKSRNKSCIGQIGAVWKCVLVSGAKKPFQRLYNLKKKRFLFKNNGFLNKKPLFFSKKRRFFFVLLHRVPIATGTMNILCYRRGAPQAQMGLTSPSSGYIIHKKSKKAVFYSKNGYLKKKTVLVASAKLEQFGSVFWYLGLTSPSNGYTIQNNSK